MPCGDLGSSPSAKCAVRRRGPPRRVSDRARAPRAGNRISNSPNTLRLAERLQMKERIRASYIPVAISSSSRISVAPSPVAPEGSSSSSSSNAGLNSGKALKSVPSRSKQASGVVARYACQAMLAVSSSSAVTSTAGTRHSPSPLRVRHDQIEVDKAQFQPGRDLRIRTEIIEQPNQLQLIVRVRIKP